MSPNANYIHKTLNTMIDWASDRRLVHLISFSMIFSSLDWTPGNRGLPSSSRTSAKGKTRAVSKPARSAWICELGPVKIVEVAVIPYFRPMSVLSQSIKNAWYYSLDSLIFHAKIHVNQDR